MNLRSTRLWISVVSLVAVSLFAIVDSRRASPGPVSSVHARVDDLHGRSGCSGCHGGWFSTMTDACQKCHAPIHEQLQTRQGLHGRLDPAVAGRCSDCHSEHHGESFAIVNDQSFRGAGSRSTKEFDHAFVGFEMTGRHLEITCADCHEHADDRVLPDKAVRYLGLAQDCGSCHEDPHEGRMQVACAACHGQAKWDELHSLGHEKFLPLVGGHGNVSCRKCHGEDEPHSLESMGMKGPRPPARDCAACHASPHTPGFSTAVANLAGAALGASCVTCHAAEHSSFRQPGLTITAQQHALSGFPLDVPHDKATCADCHAPDKPIFAERYPGRPKNSCTACHADPHGGQFARGPFAGQECTACHDRERFEPHAFTLEKHELASLPLTGKHVETDCNACHRLPAHAEGDKVPRTFHGTPSNCDACHRDAHGGFFEEIPSRPAPRHGQCEQCHDTIAFADIPPPGFDHAQFTGFAVLGAHAQSECTSCHPLSPARDETGRAFGRVEQRFGELRGCVTCHADVHNGRFDRPDLPAEVDGRTDCARCHDDTSFRSFSRGFDHGQWTGFDLVGAHQAACSTCHEPMRKPDAAGRTWQKAQGAGCADCHIDPHAGQFDGNGGAKCTKCHTDRQPSFLSFNHDRDSRFPLREQHDGLECAACHKTWTSPDGIEVVRYRPLGRECVDCHGEQESVLMHRKRRNG